MTARKKFTLLLAIPFSAWLLAACEQKNTYVEPPPHEKGGVRTEK